MKQILILTSLFCCLVLPVTAASDAELCKDPQTQTDMNICASQAYQRADKILNQLFQQIKRKYRSQDFKKLQQVQFDWLKFRDSHCKFEASFYEGGTLQPLIHGKCMETLTLERNLHFKALLDGPPY